MTGKSFALVPFPAPAPVARLSKIRLEGSCNRKGDTLTLKYELSGDLSGIVLPGVDPVRERRHGLWNATCFEFFLARGDGQGYHEFNLSPAGHWNAFRFTGYRQGMCDETVVSRLPFTVSRSAGELQIGLTVDLSGLPAPEPANVEGSGKPGRERSSETATNATNAGGTINEGPLRWRLAVATVLLGTDGTPSYWAVSHPAPEADFHHPGAFVIEL